MGIYDRDYYRENSRGFLEAWGRQGVTVWLIVINCVVFALQILTADGRDFADSLIGQLMIYDPDAIRRGEVWRLVTSLFLHASLWHIAFNMLALYFSGAALEELYGGLEFLLLYLCAGVFASLLVLLTQIAADQHYKALGASGAVTAVLVVFAFHYPHRRVNLYFVISMPVWLAVVIYVLLDTVGALGFGPPGIGYVAHLGGALFGLVYYKSGRRISSLIPSRGERAARPVAAPRLRVVPPDPEPTEPPPEEPVGAAVEPASRPSGASDEPFEAKVDRVLEKVSKHGQESLTPEEREILFKASERYKKRRK
jgi:membrane associated rhomboid family serine protease